MQTTLCEWSWWLQSSDMSYLKGNKELISIHLALGFIFFKSSISVLFEFFFCLFVYLFQLSSPNQPTSSPCPIIHTLFARASGLSEWEELKSTRFEWKEHWIRIRISVLILTLTIHSRPLVKSFNSEWLTFSCENENGLFQRGKEIK